MRKRYNTPHRSRVVKTRMTEEESTSCAMKIPPAITVLNPTTACRLPV